MNRAAQDSHKQPAVRASTKPFSAGDALAYIERLFSNELINECSVAEQAIQGAFLRRQAISCEIEQTLRDRLSQISPSEESDGVAPEVIETRLKSHLEKAAHTVLEGLEAEGFLLNPHNHPEVGKFHRALDAFRRHLTSTERGQRALSVLTTEFSTPERPAMEIEILEILCLSKAHRRSVTPSMLKEYFTNVGSERFLLQ